MLICCPALPDERVDVGVVAVVRGVAVVPEAVGARQLPAGERLPDQERLDASARPWRRVRRRRERATRTTLSSKIAACFAPCASGGNRSRRQAPGGDDESGRRARRPLRQRPRRDADEKGVWVTARGCSRARFSVPRSSRGACCRRVRPHGSAARGTGKRGAHRMAVYRWNGSSRNRFSKPSTTHTPRCFAGLVPAIQSH